MKPREVTRAILPSRLPATALRLKAAAARDVTARIAMALSALAAVAILLASVAALGAPTFPALTGQIVDNANILSSEDRAAIDAELKALEAKSTDQLVVVTVPSNLTIC